MPSLARFKHGPKVAFVAVAFAVLAFSWGWPGKLTLDGPGVSLYVRLAIDHLQHGGGVPYWMPEMWAGAPAWALAPSFPTLALVPLGILVGADRAVQLATLAAQVVGGWGAFVLARSLWDGDRRRSTTALPLAAAVLYALHPLFVSHGALFGHETSLWVMAFTPWLAWALRLAFRSRPGDQPGLRGRNAAKRHRYAVIAGLLAGVSILQQAEHAYGLAVLCACQLLIEVAVARRRGPGGVRAVLAEAGIVVAVALGVTAFWLLPFLALNKSFVLTPPDVVRSVLEEGIGSVLGHEPGTFLSRAHAITGTVGFEGNLLAGNVYLSWVCLVPTFVTALLLSRHDEDGHLTAILVAGAVGVWFSSAGIPLADSGPAQRLEPLPFIVIGTLVGLLVGSCLRRAALRGRGARIGFLGALGVLLAMPYVTPFLALQRVVPLLASVRFPRFYPVAALGLALGAVYPLRFLAPWAARHRHASLAPMLTSAAALALVAAFFVDVHPYRSFYRTRPPDDAAAYRQAAASLQAVGSDFRVIAPQFGDPRVISSLLTTGSDVSSGWPHPIAGRQAWRLTGEALIAPPSYREAALGLSATAYTAVEQLTQLGPKTEEVSGVYLARNPEALPFVRAYSSAVVVQDAGITPELAVALARRNIGVVVGGPAQARLLGGVAGAALGAADACRGPATATGPATEPGTLGSEVAMACALHRWIGIYAGLDYLPVTGSPGGVFRSPADGLEAVSVWLDRPPGATVLSLHEVTPTGALGPEVARATSSEVDWDANAMYAFRFPRLAGSAGKQYAFVLSCPDCGDGPVPQLVATRGPRGAGDLLVNGKVDRSRAGAFSLVYDRMPEATPSDTQIRATEAGPGHWKVGVAGGSPALVVVSEANFPGWRATVDGKPAPVLEADGAFLGVAVAAGDHTVELTYHPPGVAVVGRAITGGTLAALLLAGPITRRRRRARREPVTA